jgi:anti-sigma-K factor RskA
MNRQELIAAYALGELEGAERDRFEREVAADPALRAEVEATRGTMVQLEALPGEAWPETARGSEADGLVGRDAPHREALPLGAAASPTPASRRRFALRPLAVAAIVLVSAVIGGGVGALIAGGGDSSSSPPAKTVVVLKPLDAPKDSRADVSMPKADTMLLRTHGLPPSAAGDYYEVWLMSSDAKLVPVASFRVDDSGEASVEVPLPAAPSEYAYFDVSRQTIAGGLAHSQDSVLRGPTGGGA